MKGIKIIFLIALIVIADQVLKIYIKTHYHIGESHNVLGNWFKLYFIENEGMAYGWKFGGQWGKMLLTGFRMAAVIFGIFYIRNIIRKKFHPGFIFCVALIFAGALGNLIDSMFYGLIFEYSNPATGNVAAIFPDHGYAGFLHGNVVDMLYFPIIDSTFPGWMPIWGGEDFIFFSPIFNLADASISVGIISILVFQKKFFKPSETAKDGVSETTPDKGKA
ncbi:MAG: lipoprotein signal peptidase [Chitinophagaceae bacterium]|nr:lipoprotein signal peptidase [Chitinophagaceae bacterium]